VFVGQLRKVVGGWERGIVAMNGAAEKAPADRAGAARAEVRLARAAAMHLASVADQAQFVLTRDALAKPDLPKEEREELKATVRRLLQAEERRARELYFLQRQDSRIGFEASNHYYYLPQDLEEKFLNCQWLMETMGK